MHTLPTAHPHQLPIKTDYDVVIMRQHVRHLARDLGLALSQQAKISTAISTVTRALIVLNCSTTVQLWVDDAAPRPALAVTCRFRPSRHLDDLAHLEQVLCFGEARMLVDEAALSSDAHGVLLSLRMWLSR
jgi:hypothetical protein